MENNNKIMQSFWIGEHLSVMELLCINSCLKNGHDFHLYLYKQIQNVPQEVIIKDANEIIPEKFLFKDSINSFASFSDWFRFKLLFKKGGWWTDMDSICLKSFNIPEEYCFPTEVLKRFSSPTICIGNLKVPAGCEIMGECVEIIEHNYSKFEVIPWGLFGLYLFRRIIYTYDSAPYIRSPDVFHPIALFDFDSFTNGQCNIEFSNNSLAVHLYNGMWTYKNLDKNASYHPKCLYEKLKGMYLFKNA